MIIFLFFILGSVVGSFLNVVIFRLKSGEPFWFGRSRCNHCRKQLSAWEMVPILSFVYVRGRCLHCKTKLSWQYPIVELSTAFLFGLFALNFYPSLDLNFILALVLASVLLVIAVFDLKYYLILDKVIFAAIPIALLRLVYLGQVIHGLEAALAISGFFLAQHLLSRGRWIGFGDVKLGLLLGLIAPGAQAVSLMFIAYFAGAVSGLILIALDRKQLSSQLPFGLFLGVSGIITLLYGTAITGWYLKLIGL